MRLPAFMQIKTFSWVKKMFAQMKMFFILFIYLSFDVFE